MVGDVFVFGCVLGGVWLFWLILWGGVKIFKYLFYLTQL
ncbi:hypothetical protein GMMP13_1550011 [Candidatus Magnetomoraceae bacterium gMMP-13]